MLPPWHSLMYDNGHPISRRGEGATHPGPRHKSYRFPEPDSTTGDARRFSPSARLAVSRILFLAETGPPSALYSLGVLPVRVPLAP